MNLLYSIHLFSQKPRLPLFSAMHVRFLLFVCFPHYFRGSLHLLLITEESLPWPNNITICSRLSLILYHIHFTYSQELVKSLLFR